MVTSVTLVPWLPGVVAAGDTGAVPHEAAKQSATAKPTVSVTIAAVGRPPITSFPGRGASLGLAQLNRVLRGG